MSSSENSPEPDTSGARAFHSTLVRELQNGGQPGFCAPTIPPATQARQNGCL